MTWKERIAAQLPQLQKDVRKLTRNHHEGLDLVMDTVEKALRSEQLYNEQNNFNAWLFAIMKNIFLQEKRGMVRWIDISDAWLIPGVDYRESNHDRELILAEIMKLECGISKRILLLSLRGYTNKEMARAMRISNEAVRQRIHYARFLLRRKLQPLWPKDSLHARIIRHGKRA